MKKPFLQIKGPSKKRANQNRSKYLIGKNTAIILLCILIIAILITALVAQTERHSTNQAEKRLSPITSRIEQIGGKKICTYGDSGHSISNNSPWHTAYYSIPNTTWLKDDIVSYAYTLGYKLVANQAYIDDLRDGGGYGDEQYSPDSDYLMSNLLNVSIYRNSEVSLLCTGDNITYGSKRSTDSGAIVKLDMILPESMR